MDLVNTSLPLLPSFDKNSPAIFAPQTATFGKFQPAVTCATRQIGDSDSQPPGVTNNLLFGIALPCLAEKTLLIFNRYVAHQR
jgi:hypothetical protein